ncbi:MAG: hypothetical protein Ta2A_01940 [Treponemataceae bacterium]|nr:MAG: hypothetical protein Ta2A_01940 [Treponemataceae bacterium]
MAESLILPELPESIRLSIEKNNASHTQIRDFFIANGFLPLDVASYPALKSYSQESLTGDAGRERRFHSALWSVCPVGVLTWAYWESALYKIIEGQLCSIWFPHTKRVCFVIHGSAGQKIIDTLHALAIESGMDDLHLKCIEDRALETLQKITGYKTIKIKSHEDDDEYVFHPADLLEQTGKVNEEKRRHLRKCASPSYGNVEIVEMTADNVQVMNEIENAWCTGRDCTFCSSFCGCEKEALNIMLNIYDPKMHKGLLLYQDGKPAGYAIGEVMNKRIANMYYGKALINDFFVYLILEMTKRFFSDCEYINMADDMGNMGLRIFKRHLGTYETWKRYTVSYKK